MEDHVWSTIYLENFFLLGCAVVVVVLSSSSNSSSSSSNSSSSDSDSSNTSRSNSSGSKRMVFLVFGNCSGEGIDKDFSKKKKSEAKLFNLFVFSFGIQEDITQNQSIKLPKSLTYLF